MKVTALKYAESTLPQDQVLLGGDKTVRVPISFIIYLIETGERKILVDAGCETMPGFDMKHFCSPVAVLERYGLRPEDITDVAVTHAHHDHIEAVKHFGSARIYIQKDEYEAGKQYIPSDFQVCLFEDSQALCSHVRIRKIGGHSKGSCIVEFEAGGKLCIIAGDEVYARECLEREIPTGVSFCPLKSHAFVKQYGSGHCLVLLCHDDAVLPGQNGFKVLYQEDSARQDDIPEA